MLHGIKDYYDYIDREFTDPRTRSRFLVSSPYPMLGVISVYLCLVKIIPIYMKYRKPLDIRNVICYYNIFQVIFNSYIVYLGLSSGYTRRYKFFECRDLNMSTTDPDAVRAMECIYAYYISKIIEFLDTIFFALRKKDSHISFLHVFHHSTMAFNGWIGCKFLAGGSATMFAVVNSSVHVAMYSYYFLSSLGPKWQKYLSWKRYLTIIQMIQFCFGILGAFYTASTFDKCPETAKRQFVIWYITIYVFIILCLFLQYYRDTYNRTSKKELNGGKQKLR